MKKLFLAMAIAIVTATAVSAQEDKMVISTVQADKDNGYEGNTATRCGIKFNIKLSGVTKVELESVDGNYLAGTASFKKDSQGVMSVEKMQAPSSRLTLMISPALLPERIITSSLCLATFMEDIGFPSTATDLWLIISECIRR